MYKVTISALEFIKKFPDRDSARTFLELKRWNNNPSCPSCGCVDNQYKQFRGGVAGYFRCNHCNFTYTVRTGTIFERSNVPLDKWLLAIYLVVDARKGITSVQLSKEIGGTQKTAWFMLHRIREPCRSDNDSNGFLQGIIEADEIYIGGKEANKHESKKLKAGRGAVVKIAVLGMCERGGKVVAKVLNSTSKEAIHTELNASIADGAVLCTDEHRSYQGNKYVHRVVNHSAKQYVNGMAYTNGIESVWAVLKRGLYDVYHSFSAKHLQRYVDEFSYRLNEGNVRVHTMDRIDALLGKAIEKLITYAAVTA